MKAIFTILAIFLLGFTSSCMNVKARYAFNAETDFDALKTYAWEANTQEIFTNPMDAEHYMDVMNAQLASKGFSLETENPDFLIHTSKAIKNREIYLTAFYGEVEFHRGKIALEFVDAESGEAFWEGVAQAYLSEESKPNEIKKNITKGVENLMKGFPPRF